MITLNNINLKSNFNFNVTGITGLDAPPVAHDTMEFYRQAGEKVLYTRYQPRKINVSGVMYGSSYDDAVYKKNAFARLLSSTFRSPKVMSLSERDRGIFVQLAKGDSVTFTPVGPFFNHRVFEVQFILMAHNPMFYHTSITPSEAKYVIPNLVEFGDFETSTFSQDVWEKMPSTMTTNFYSKTTNDQSQKVYYVNSGSLQSVGIKQRITGITGGETYYASAYLKKIPVTNIESSAPYIKLVYGNSAGDSFSPSTGTITGTVNNTWVRIGGKITIPSGVEFLDYEVVQDTATGKIASFAVDLATLNNLSVYELDTVADSTLNSNLPFTMIEG